MMGFLLFVCEYGNCHSAHSGDAVGLLDMPVSQHSRGQYTAEICCKLAGMATVKAKLNGKTVGQPITLPIKASAASQLRLAGKGSLRCTAGACFSNGSHSV
jgi:hypothetical protein